MKRFLGLSEEEIKENQKLWHEERIEPDEDAGKDAKGGDLRSIGISPGDIESDLETADNMGDMEGTGDMGDMGAVGDAGAGGDMGATPAQGGAQAPAPGPGL
jgi:hypothetical protein